MCQQPAVNGLNYGKAAARGARKCPHQLMANHPIVLAATKHLLRIEKDFRAAAYPERGPEVRTGPCCGAAEDEGLVALGAALRRGGSQPPHAGTGQSGRGPLGDAIGRDDTMGVLEVAGSVPVAPALQHDQIPWPAITCRRRCSCLTHKIWRPVPGCSPAGDGPRGTCRILCW